MGASSQSGVRGLARLARVWIPLLAILLPACSPEPVNPDGRRVFVFAVDGVSWRILDPLLERGELPNLAGLIERGSSGELETIAPAHSPVIWTSVATGKGKEKHGIGGFWYDLGPDELAATQEEQDFRERLEAIGYIGGDEELRARKGLYHSGKRRARTLWQILSDFGLESAILGWWISYPAEPLRGRLVSDRYVYNRFQLAASEKGILYESAGRHLWPEELAGQLDPLIVKTDQVSGHQLQRFIRGEVEAPRDLSLHGEEDELRIVFAKDRSLVAIARALLDDGVPDLFAVYIQGPDIASHYFWKYRFPGEWNRRYPAEPVDPAAIQRYGEVIDAYYRQVDEWLGELLAYADEHTAVIFLSDHGFTTGRRSAGAGQAAETVSGVHSPHSPPGVLVLAGDGIPAGKEPAGAHVYDIAPTVLTLFGLPAARDMDGRVLEPLLEERVTRPSGSRESYE